MKKIVLFIVFTLLILTNFTGCGGKTYSFNESSDEIEIVEIVSAESSLDFTVTKTLSEAEKIDFFKQFQSIQFHSYYVGDPMAVNGNAVKITYRNGDYEIICYYWAEYVKNGEAYNVRKGCDEKVFNELLNNFLGRDTNT